MAIVPLVEREDMSPDQVAVYDEVLRRRGRMGNIFKALANSPSMLQCVASTGEYFRHGSRLDTRLREAVILTVAHELQAAYVWSHHWRIAAEVCLDPTALFGSSERIEEQLGVIGPDVLAYTLIVTRGEPLEDALIHRLRDRLSEDVLVDLTVAIGHYGMLGRLTKTLRIPLEEWATLVPFQP